MKVKQMLFSSSTSYFLWTSLRRNTSFSWSKPGWFENIRGGENREIDQFCHNAFYHALESGELGTWSANDFRTAKVHIIDGQRVKVDRIREVNHVKKLDFLKVYRVRLTSFLGADNTAYSASNEFLDRIFPVIFVIVILEWI